jgi:hypothetical protein
MVEVPSPVAEQLEDILHILFHYAYAYNRAPKYNQTPTSKST